MLGPLGQCQEVGSGRLDRMSSSMVAYEVSEVGRGQVMEGFVSKQQDFEVCSLGDGEPVQHLKDWGDVVMGA